MIESFHSKIDYEVATTYMYRAEIGMFGYSKLDEMGIDFLENFADSWKGDTEVAYGWSDQGVTKVARIILIRFTDTRAWEHGRPTDKNVWR